MSLPYFARSLTVFPHAESSSSKLNDKDFEHSVEELLKLAGVHGLGTEEVEKGYEVALSSQLCALTNSSFHRFEKGILVPPAVSVTLTLLDNLQLPPGPSHSSPPSFPVTHSPSDLSSSPSPSSAKPHTIADASTRSSVEHSNSSERRSRLARSVRKDWMRWKGCLVLSSGDWSTRRSGALGYT